MIVRLINFKKRKNFSLRSRFRTFLRSTKNYIKVFDIINSVLFFKLAVKNIDIIISKGVLKKKRGSRNKHNLSLKLKFLIFY